MSTQTLAIYFTFWSAILGSVIGSFLCCVVSRRQSGESVLRGRSHCEACGHVLRVLDLMPVMSYIVCRGRCRYCGVKIPPACLMAELGGAVVYAGVVFRFGLSWDVLMWLAAGTLLLALSLIDGAERIIPDGLLLSLAVNRLLFFVLFHGSLGKELLSMLGGVLIIPPAMLGLTLAMDKVMGKETMGGGDIKLMFVLGMYMDWKKMFLTIFISCLLGLAWAVAGKIFHKDGHPDGAIAFGPFLCMGCLAAVSFGDPFIEWYLNLF